MDIGTHGLFCLEDENYAAIALYMQCIAEQIDSVLTDQDADFDTALTRPTVVVNTLVNKSFTFPNSSRTNIYDNILFSNSPIFSLDTTTLQFYLNIGSPVGTAVPLNYPTGLWMIGASAQMVTAGAIGTPLGSRELELTVYDDLSLPPGQAVAFYEDVTFQNGASDAVTVKGPVILRGTHGVRVGHTFIGNALAATGNVTIQAGALLWATYVGPDELVEVA